MYGFGNSKSSEPCFVLAARYTHVWEVSMISVENFVGPRHGVVITLCSGYVTRNDVVKSIEALRKDPSFRPNFRQLINVYQESKLRLDFKDLYGIHEIYDPFSGESRRAIVAPQGGAAYKLAQMYRAIVDREHMEVFVSLLDAISWLGLEVTVLEAAIQRGRASSRARLETGMIFDLPSEVPQTFRPIRKKLRNAARLRKG